MKKINQYSSILSQAHMFDKVPKTVFAAIAVSYATQLGNGELSIPELLLKEWTTLHANGIIPQKPIKVAL